jgi:hypothetical protein
MAFTPLPWIIRQRDWSPACQGWIESHLNTGKSRIQVTLKTTTVNFPFKPLREKYGDIHGDKEWSVVEEIDNDRGAALPHLRRAALRVFHVTRQFAY